MKLPSVFISTIKSKCLWAGAVGLLLFAFIKPVPSQVARRIPDVSMNVNAVRGVNGQIWLATTKGAYILQPNGPQLISKVDLNVSDVIGHQGQVWLATDKGAYLVEGGSARRTPDIDLDVEAIEVVQNQVWLLTDRGAYVINNNVPQPIATESLAHASAIKVIGPQIWLGTGDGPCRVEGLKARCISITIPIPGSSS